MVERVKGKMYSANYIQEWRVKCWQEVPDKSYEVLTLARGWFMIKFSKKEALEWVLERNWNFGKIPILFKRWNPLFDTQREKVDEMPVWVRLPGLPPQFWVQLVFREIKNNLGHFLEANMSFVHSSDKGLAKILISLNLREGLAEEINLKYKDFSYTQMIDYEQLSL